MTSDFYFTATSWFPGKCPRKTPFKAQYPWSASIWTKIVSEPAVCYCIIKLIGMNSTFTQILGKFWKKNLIQPTCATLCSTHWPPKNWPCAIEHLAIGLVDNKYTKLGKIDVTYFGVSPYKSPIVLVPVIGYIHFSMGLIESIFFMFWTIWADS